MESLKVIREMHITTLVDVRGSNLECGWHWFEEKEGGKGHDRHYLRYLYLAQNKQQWSDLQDRQTKEEQRKYPRETPEEMGG